MARGWWHLVLAATSVMDVGAGSFLTHVKNKQPVRCSWIVCSNMGGKCKVDTDCVTDKCYEGKCANAATCRPAGDICYNYASQTCCTGKCEPIVLRQDCERLLKKQGTLKAGVGVSLDRTCAKIGVCKHWPDAVHTGPLSTPWAVPRGDLASKYWDVQGLTFAAGVVIRKDLFIARRGGQEYKDIDASSVLPGTIRDAGVITFGEESKVDFSKSGRYLEGKTAYCAAPILKDGLGGGYYAVGKDCCTLNGDFTCGDTIIPGVRTSLVLTSETPKYQAAVAKIEAAHGGKIHPEGKGIHTTLPIFVRVKKDYKRERAQPEAGYTYVAEDKDTTCIAPVWDASAPDNEINFWAAGMNCCSKEAGFHCGDADIESAHSGTPVLDDKALYKTATLMAQVKYHVTCPARPYFLEWTDNVMVPNPYA